MRADSLAPPSRAPRASQVKLTQPAVAGQPPKAAWFVAVAAGVLVSEDWAGHGSVTLLAVAKERVEAGGAWEDVWGVRRAHAREFSGPVTALAVSEGNLVAAYGHNVRD